MIESAIDIASVAPKWSGKERDLWLDLFSNFCDSVMGSTLEETSGLNKYPEEQLKGDITLAAELADHAIQEVQYRFYKHAHQVKQRAAAKARARR